MDNSGGRIRGSHSVPGMYHLDLLAPPACLECDTVLRDGRHGLICHTCGLVFLPEEWLLPRALSEGDE